MVSSTCLMFLLAPAFPDRKSILSNFNLFDQSAVLQWKSYGSYTFKEKFEREWQYDTQEGMLEEITGREGKHRTKALEKVQQSSLLGYMTGKKEV